MTNQLTLFGHAATTINVCQRDGCLQSVVKSRRWCAQHLPEPKASDVRLDLICEVCGRKYGHYDSMLRNVRRAELRALYLRACRGCRQGFTDAIKQHQLSAAWAIRLMSARECELCGRSFPIGRKGRPQSAVDHDHACCPITSCGECVRGILCTRCNTRIAAFEGLRDAPGLDRVTAYLKMS